MIKKILNIALAGVFALVLFPKGVRAEGGGSSHLLPPTSHGTVVKKYNLSTYSGFTATDATLEIYQDGYSIVKSNSTTNQMIDGNWIDKAMDAYIASPDAVDITSITLDSDTKIITDTMYAIANNPVFMNQDTSKLEFIDYSKTTPVEWHGYTSIPDSTPDAQMPNAPQFMDRTVKKVIFGPNWSNLILGKSVNGMFANSHIEEVVGFEYLKLRPTDAQYMFAGVKDMKINLSNLDLTHVSNMVNMFNSSNLDFGDLFSRQIVDPQMSAYAFTDYKSNKVIDVTGIRFTETWAIASDTFSNIDVPGMKFDFRTSTAKSLQNALANLPFSIDTTKLPQPPHNQPYTTTVRVLYDHDGYDRNSPIKAQYSQLDFDFSNYNSDYVWNDAVSDSSIIKQPNLQIMKTSSYTKVGTGNRDFGIQSDSQLFTPNDKYTGRWVLKYNSDGSTIPVADRKYATDPTQLSNTDGYWVRETKNPELEPIVGKGRTYETEDSKWTTNSDGSMTYIMKIHDKSIPHYIVEEDSPNYNRTDETFDINGMKVSKAKMEGSNLVADVINETVNKQETRTLTLQKVVDVQDSTTFTFDIHLEGMTGIKKFSNVMFKDGNATVSLLGNEKISMELPKDTKYTITERAVQNWEQVSKTNDTGTLELNTTSVFTNKKTAVPTSTNETDLSIEKSVPDSYKGYNGDNPFPIKVTISGLTPTTEYHYEQYGANYTFTSDENGIAKITDIQISKSSPIKIKVAGADKFKYTVTELKADPTVGYSFTPSYQLYQDDNLIDNVGGKANKDLTTKTYVAETGKVNRLVFTNDIYDLYQFTVTKQLEGDGDSNQKFDFTASITGLKEDDVIKYRGYSDSDYKLLKSQGDLTELNFKLKDGDGLEFYGIPMYAKISITENANKLGYVSNYMDQNGVSTTNDVVGKEMSTPFISGDPNNTYINMGFTNKKVQTITTSKIVTGTQGNKNELFNFKAKLTAEDDSIYTGKIILTRKNGQKEELIPNAENEYTYQMQHGDIMQLSGFDTKIKTIELTEEDNNYSTKVMVVGETPVDSKTITVNVEDSDKHIQFTNNLGFAVPTGITLPIGGAFLLIVGLGIIITRNKGRE